ncbi:MAG: c-type cytochrome [Acidobacteriota bacterium]
MPVASKVRVSVLVALAAALVSVPAGGQIPESFSNLKVLDPEISRADLLVIMRSWTSALGVRCTHCHVDARDRVGTDFAADDRAAKHTAREMVRMVEGIRNGSLASLPTAESRGSDEAPPTVACFTCHRGMARPPRPILDELADAAGPPSTATPEVRSAAVVERFLELRSAHAGAGRYDLRPEALFRFARRQLDADQGDTARAVLLALHDLHPDFADAYALRAQVELQVGNHDAARKALKKATDLDPENQLAAWIQGRMPPAPPKAEAAADGDS